MSSNKVGQGGCLHVFGILGVTATWGSQSWLQPPFQAAPFLVREVSALQQQDPFSVVERGAASKGGCSHDWLPHVAVTPKITKTDKRPAKRLPLATGQIPSRPV